MFTEIETEQSVYMYSPCIVFSGSYPRVGTTLISTLSVV